MSASPKLPPAGRDFLVYERIVIDGLSTRQVAEEVRVSQTRVRQIVLRVTQWLVQTLPADDEQSEAAQLRLGRHIAADRLERFYVETNRAWLQTTQTKFANVCLRVIAAQSKLPAIPGTLEALAMDAIIGPLPDDVGQTFLSAKEKPAPNDAGVPVGERSSTTAKRGRDLRTSRNSEAVQPPTPPLRDCSPSPSIDRPPAEKSPSAQASTPPPTEPCDMQPSPVRAARRAFLAPAHLASALGNEAPVTELKITPEDLGLTTNKSLSRKDRRRLRRMALTK